MSKIKINEIESATTNANLKVTPNGTGTLKVSGDNDGTLKLNDSQNINSVKVKAPPSSAAQNYTLTLPDTNLVQGDYLQVGSITGSGSTAEGQLTYASIAAPDTSNLDASNLTSGTVSRNLFPFVNASNGGGYKLQSTHTTTPGNVTQIQITGLYNNRMYKIIGQDMSFHQNSTTYTQDALRIEFQDYSSNAFSNIVYNRIWHNSGSNMIKSYGDGYSRTVIECDMWYNPQAFCFEMELCTGYSGSGNDVAKHPWMFMTMRNAGMFGDIGRFHAYFDKRQTNRFISKIRLYPASYNWFGACKILVYRYEE